MAAAPDSLNLTRLTEPEILLLRAALPTGEAPAAWQAWRAGTVLDTISTHGFRLLPQVYLNLTKAPGAGSDLTRLKGIYRKAWVENQMWQRVLAQVLAALGRAGVTPLLPGGVSVAMRWYADPTARPCDDHELLIRPSQFALAGQALRPLGWRPLRVAPAPRVPRPRQSARWLAPDGRTVLDLRPYLMRETRHLEAEHHWWPHVQGFTVEGAPSQGLGAADQLLYLCVEGCRGNAPVRLRWAADAWRVVTGMSQSAPDWEHLLLLAQELRLTLPVAEALTFLAQVLGAGVPTSLIAELRAVPITRREAHYFSLNASPRGPLREAPVWLADHARLAEQGRFGGLLGLPRFLWQARG